MRLCIPVRCSPSSGESSHERHPGFAWEWSEKVEQTCLSQNRVDVAARNFRYCRPMLDKVQRV